VRQGPCSPPPRCAGPGYKLLFSFVLTANYLAGDFLENVDVLKSKFE